jgi:hypothetical protein
MKTRKVIINRLYSLLKISALSLLITLPLEVRAEYFLVYGAPVSYSSCDTCTVVYKKRPVHHRYHAAKYKKHKPCYQSTSRRHSSYTMTVYYPLPAYAWAPPPCGGCCCDTSVRGFSAGPSYPGVYFVEPGDRLVGNDYYTTDTYFSSNDMGTADNDVY